MYNDNQQPSELVEEFRFPRNLVIPFKVEHFRFLSEVRFLLYIHKKRW